MSTDIVHQGFRVIVQLLNERKRPERAVMWCMPQSPLYQLLNGPQEGETGPMLVIQDLAGDDGLVLVPWMATTRAGQTLIETRKGWRAVQELIP